MSSRLCPDCGRELPAGRPDGLCPHCLLQLGTKPDAPAAAGPASSGTAESAGQRVANYRLLELIGEGGFGMVWLAEQEMPVRRQVALKIIKLGMDTKEVIARFEAERQALALMDHPHIARVFDGGATETGRPYFVMEYVRGARITEYCDAAKLNAAARLQLFIQVCLAVQHAHQKGVIHRDLKPSNVLVTEQDGVAVPKVIDFGIAKATECQLTEKTVFTRFNQLIGTPAYMSPEQAGLGGLDVDTRSDIYSLGVLLYELLTGRTPFSNEELLRAGLDQVLRIIREQDPPKPSTQLSTLSQADLVRVAQRRASEPARLNRLVRGELDWIVMKCLEKDRRRRYETANGLACDLERHLNNEPVAASPPSAFYRIQKAVRRNRFAVTAGFVVFVSLGIGLGVAGWMYFRERAATREQERLRRLSDANLQTAREAADRMLTRFAEELKDKPHLIGLSRKLLEDALELHEGFLQQEPENPEMRHELAKSCMRVGFSYQMLGRFEESFKPRNRALALLEELSRDQPGVAEYREEIAQIHEGMAFASYREGRPVHRAEHSLAALAIWEELSRAFPDSPKYLKACANAHANFGNSLEGEERLNQTERALATYADFRSRFPNEPEDLELEAHIQHWYGAALVDIGRMPQAEPAYRRCRELRARLLAEHPDIPGYKTDLAHINQYLGNFYKNTNRPEEALPFLQESIALEEQILKDYPEYTTRGERAGINYRTLAQIFTKLDRKAEAEAALRRSAEVLTRVTTNAPNELYTRWVLSRTQCDLIVLLESVGRTNDAQLEFQRCVQLVQEMTQQSATTFSNFTILQSALREWSLKNGYEKQSTSNRTTERRLEREK